MILRAGSQVAMPPARKGASSSCGSVHRVIALARCLQYTTRYFLGALADHFWTFLRRKMLLVPQTTYRPESTRVVFSYADYQSRGRRIANKTSLRLR